MTRSNTRSLILVAAVILMVASIAVYRRQAKPPPKNDPVLTISTQSAELPRMVDLGADKCAPCKEMAPILVDLRKEYAGRATIEFIDVWKNPGTGETYGVRIIPTQIFFDRTGKEVWRHEGFLSKAEIRAKLKEMGAG